MKEELTIQEFQALGTEMLRTVVAILEEEGIRYHARYGTLLGTIRHKGPIPWDNDIDLSVAVEDIEKMVSVFEKKLPEKYWTQFRSDKKHPHYFPRVGLRGYDTESFHIDFYPMAGMPDDLKKSVRIRKYAKTLFIILRAKTAHSYTTHRSKFRTFAAKATRVITCLIPTSLITRQIDRLIKKYPVEGRSKIALLYGKKRLYNAEWFGEGIMMPYADFMIRVPNEYDLLLKNQYGDYMKFPPQEHIDKMMSKTFRLHRSQGEK